MRVYYDVLLLNFNNITFVIRLSLIALNYFYYLHYCGHNNTQFNGIASS